MWYLLIILLILTGIFFYFGFIRKETEYYLLPTIRGGSLIFFALSLIIVFAIYRETTAQYEISKYIAPYHSNTKAIYTPAIPGSKSKIWLFTTTDSPRQIELFYSDKTNLKGWKIIQGFPYLTIRKNGLEIVINTSEQKNTLIKYELRNIGI
jgi:hypothetical protein